PRTTLLPYTTLFRSHGAASALQPSYGKANSFDRDRSLVDDVSIQLIGYLDLQPPILRIENLFESDQLAYTIDMSLHQVTSQAAVHSHWQFKIHECALLHS